MAGHSAGGDRKGWSEPAAPLALALGFAAVAQGAFYRGPAIATVGLVTVAFALALTRSGPDRSDLDSAVLGCFAVGVVTAVSSLAHHDLGGAGPPLTLLAAAAATVFATKRIGADWRPVLRLAIVSVGVLVAVTSWIGSALRLEPWALVAGGLWRGASTLTYANAAAAMVAIALPLALVHRWKRAPAAVPFVLMLGLGATLSRGGMVAGLIGVAVLYGRRGPSTDVSLLQPALGALVALVGLLAGMPASGPARPITAFAALAAGAAIACAPTAATVRIVVGVVAAGVLVTLATGSPPLRTTLTGRISARSEDRTAEWRYSWRLFSHSPLTGVGPGRYVLDYTEGGDRKVAHYAHNEYLQIAAETGVFGLVATAAGLVTIFLRALRSRADYSAALAASAVAAGLDFTWHFPLIVLASAVIIGLAFST